MLTCEQKCLIAEHCQKYIDIANKVYHPIRPFPLPSVSFSLIGKVAGYAYVGQWLVKFNPVLASENFEHFLKNTIPHEVVHLVNSYNLSLLPRISRKNPSHGSDWQRVMRVFGAVPERCHSYDTKNSRSNTRKFRCACDCGKGVTIGLNIYRKIMKKEQYRIAKCCRSIIDWNCAFSEIV